MIKQKIEKESLAMSDSDFYEDENYIYAICRIKGYEDFYKEKKNKNSKIWWTNKIGVTGELNISFDRKRIYNLFQDYPYNMTKEEIEVFDKEEPYWASFFAWRINK